MQLVSYLDLLKFIQKINFYNVLLTSHKPLQDFFATMKIHCDTPSQYSKPKPLQEPFAIQNQKLWHCESRSQCSKTEKLPDPSRCSKKIATPLRNAAKQFKNIGTHNKSEGQIGKTYGALRTPGGPKNS